MTSLSWNIELLRHPQANPSLSRFFMRAQTPEGVITLRPQGSVNEDHQIRVYFQPALPDGLDFATAAIAYHAMPKDTPESDRRRAELGFGDNELGYVSQVANAMGVIETFHGLPASAKSPEELLSDAGFVFAHAIETGANPCRVFNRRWTSPRNPTRSGTFTVWLGVDWVHLTFEKNKGAHGHHNLLAFQKTRARQDDTRELLYWPPAMPFDAMALRAALVMADSWDPLQVYDQG